MPRPHLTPGKDPVPIVQEAGWALGPVWTGAENITPTGIRSPDRPARRQSLYRLSYPVLVNITECKLVAKIPLIKTKNGTLALFFVNSPTYNFLHIRSAIFKFLCAYSEADGQADFNKRFAETRSRLKIRMSRLRIVVMLPAPQKLRKLNRPHRHCYCAPHLTEPSQMNILKLGGRGSRPYCVHF